MFERLALSGEPLIPELKNGFPDGKPNTPISAAQVEKAVLRLRKYRKDYLERWMSTATSTTTGRLHPWLESKDPYQLTISSHRSSSRCPNPPSHGYSRNQAWRFILQR